MKKIMQTLSLLCITHALHAEPYVIDGLVAVIMTDEGVDPIFRSDIRRPSLSGTPVSLDDMIISRLTTLEATKLKVMPTDDAIDKYFDSLQTQHKMTRKQLEEALAQAGYTIQEAYTELKHMMANSTMIEYEIKSNLVVSKKAIEKYYNENPEYTQEKYFLKSTTIPFEEDVSPTEQLTSLKKNMKSESFRNTITWGSPFWETNNKLASAITTLSTGDMSEPLMGETGFTIYYVIEKESARLLSLEERYQDILTTLRKLRYVELMDKFKARLLANSSVELL